MGGSPENDENKKDGIDFVLEDVGEFGKYQIGHIILMILPIVLSATYAVEFIVTSSTDDYRYFSLIIIKNACIFHIHSI